jgi:hypothetical protein
MKLTNDIRGAILRALLAHRFQAEYDAIARETAAFARRVYDYRFGADLKVMAGLPEGWLLEVDAIPCAFDGRSARLNFSGEHGAYAAIKRPDPVLLPVTCASTRAHRFVSLAHDHELTRDFNAVSAKWMAFKQSFSAAQRQADTALSAASTIKRLVDVWPEVEPFARKYVTTKPQLPAIPTDALNATFRLPPETEQ